MTTFATRPSVTLSPVTGLPAPSAAGSSAHSAVRGLSNTVDGARPVSVIRPDACGTVQTGFPISALFKHPKLDALTARIKGNLVKKKALSYFIHYINMVNVSGRGEVVDSEALQHFLVAKGLATDPAEGVVLAGELQELGSHTNTGYLGADWIRARW